ncbi:MAG: helix-turn-helix domain-containing protein [Saprospiraceae bacterium]|nr:helix-turn-helix domain-containing protein [Saprospiraceae bacterium]
MDKHSTIGHVKFIRPLLPHLRPWIKGYYVHGSEDPDFSGKLTFYQNITTTLSIYLDSVTTSNNRQRSQRHQANKGFHCLLVGLVDRYQEVTFEGPLNRLAIVFQPGGLNHFVQGPLSQLLARHYSYFSEYDHEFTAFLPQLFDEPSLEGKRRLLDHFFEERFLPFGEPLLLDAIRLMTTAEEPLKVHELSSRFNVSRRTLLRKFRKHLGYSVEEYAATIKFRRALLHFQKMNPSINLTEMALESQYYDQADFNHQVKSRSGLTPTALFRELQIIDNTLFWKL